MPQRLCTPPIAAWRRTLLRRAWLLAVPLGLTLTACGGQSFVLVPDPAGQVGQVEVSTAAGTQRLEKAGIRN